MKQLNLKKNNNGSTLILIVICIAFVSILGTLLLSLTVSNLQMKSIDHKAKSNFYNAETALDEIKTGLGEETAAALEAAYKSIMEQFITTEFVGLSNDEKKAQFADKFIDTLYNSLIESYNLYDMEHLRNYVTNDQVVLETALGNNLLLVDTNKKLITLKNVKISYTDDEQYKTSIATDIVISTPSMSFQTGSDVLPSYSDYSLIADNSIKLDAATAVEARGNVYAGSNGISLDNASTLNISNTAKIVTRGDISVGERSLLNITGNSKLWAMNLATVKGADTGLTTEINIDSNCYIGDDLMLNAVNSIVKINGEYYGYSYAAGKTTETVTTNNNPAFSSAIIINGKNAVMDMSASNAIFLSGRAYLNPNTGGNTWVDPAVTGGAEPKSQENIQTGESLAVKGNQLAYLVPKEYIWCGKNPVNASVYDSRPAEEVDFSKGSTSGIRLSDYADGYTKVFYQATGSAKWVYYYIKFKSEEKANEYLQKYYELNNTASPAGIIDNRIGSYAKSIKLNNSLHSIISAGNIFTFDENTKRSSLIANSVKTDSRNASYEAMLHRKDTLITQYDAIRTTLNEHSNMEAYDTSSVFNTLIKKELLQQDSIIDGQIKNGKRILLNDYVVTIIDNESGTPYELKSTGDLPNGGLKGTVIATGSVNIKNNFEGLILSGGVITLGSGVNVTASSALIEEILSLNNDSVNKYFRNLPSPSNNEGAQANISQIKVSDLIYYDNWVKNEE